VYGAAWRTGDDETLEDIFTADAVYQSHPFRPPLEGIEAIRRYWREATSTQEDLDLRFGEPLVVGSRVVVEWWATMRDNGREITLPGCLLMRFRPGGRCQELREYWHIEEGRHAPPEGWGR
jgi:hypothetical protein